MKKKIAAIAVAIGVLGVGLLGGVVLADEAADAGKGKGLVARVAEILGLDEDTVQDAFDQARDEIRDEALDKKLDAAVEEGVLTQDQADALEEWIDARPDDLPRKFRGGFWGASEEKLDWAVEKGLLTQEQADALQEWYDDKPEDLPEGFGFGHGKKFGRKGRGSFRGGGHHRFSGEKKSPSEDSGTSTSTSS